MIDKTFSVYRSQTQNFSLCPETRPDTQTMSQGRGAFIVLEGLDRSGKTTQTAKLVEKIESLGKPCKLIKFPGSLLALLETEYRPDDYDWKDD
jgi:hypothetical protein